MRSKPLPHQRRLADPRGSAQEQAVDLLVEEVVELEHRVAARVRREGRPGRIGGKRIAFQLVLLDEQPRTFV